MMEFYLWIFVLLLMIVIVFLLLQLYLIQKSADEIRFQFAYYIQEDTNILIGISSRNKHMCALAAALNEQLKQLHAKRHRYEQGDLEIQESITNISHDLCTPLTAICGYLDLLNQEIMSERARHYWEIIANRANALRQLTEELFRYSLAASALQDLTLEEVNLNEALAESAAAYYEILKGCNIIPEISMPDEAVKQNLNRPALMRIFANILSNAVKYSDGDLKITLSENREIHFSNHASNLDEIQIAKLFDRFYTVETASHSTGLGLSIAKTLTEQMGGTIKVGYHNQILTISLFW